jgi:hypothetical protein
MSSTRDFVAATLADATLPLLRRPVEDLIYETLDTRQIPNRTDFKELRDLVNNLRGQLGGVTSGIKRLADQAEGVDEQVQLMEGRIEGLSEQVERSMAADERSSVGFARFRSVSLERTKHPGQLALDGVLGHGAFPVRQGLIFNIN